MVLSTSGKNYTRADGTIVENVRLRYQCHNQVRHPDLCDGQNTYRAERVDTLVAESIRRLFVYIKTISEKEVIQAQVRRQELFCRSQLKQANRLLDSKSKELSDYHSEVLKVIRSEPAENGHHQWAGGTSRRNRQTGKSRCSALAGRTIERPSKGHGDS